MVEDRNAFEVHEEVTDAIVVVESESSRGVESIGCMRDGDVVDYFGSRTVNTSIGDSLMCIVLGSRVEEYIGLLVVVVVDSLSIADDSTKVVRA